MDMVTLRLHTKQLRMLADTRAYVLFPGGRRRAIIPPMTATLPTQADVQERALIALVTGAVVWSPWVETDTFDRVPQVDNFCHLRVRVGVHAQAALPAVVLVEYNWLDRHTNAVVAVHVSTHTWAAFRGEVYNSTSNKALNGVRGLVRNALDELATHMRDTQTALDTLM